MNEELFNINQTGESKSLIRFHLCGTTFPDEDYRIVRPNSKVYCLEYVESGQGTVHLDGETFFPCGGDSYFLQARKDQDYYADRQDPWKKHFVNLSGPLVDRLTEGYCLTDASHFKGLDLSQELRELIFVAKSGQMDCTASMIGILNGIFLKMYSALNKTEETGAMGRKMKDFLNTQIASEFRLSLLCQHVSLSESQTIRLFKSLFGTTPYAYLLRKKIDFAKNLLVNTNLSGKEVAAKLCFSDEYYFSNVFKKKTGLTPTQFRKLAEKSKEEPS